jgi:hypothetical protein
MFIVCDNVCFPEASFRSETCQVSLLMKLKNDRAGKYKHFTPNGVAMRSNVAAKHHTSIKYNVNPLWEARMLTQYWILNLAAAAIATSAIVIAYAQEPQKQSPQKPADSAQDNRQESKKKEIVCAIPIPTFPIRISCGFRGTRFGR